MTTKLHKLRPAKPKRIQRKRSKGWRKPAGVVNVTRPGKWGNPFSVAEYHDHALVMFESYLGRALASDSLDLEELRGKDLMCWCKVGASCHGDVLLEMANRPESV